MTSVYTIKRFCPQLFLRKSSAIFGPAKPFVRKGLGLALLSASSIVRCPCARWPVFGLCVRQQSPATGTVRSFLSTVTVGQFYDWLVGQQIREDAVGDYARKALRNTRYPRSSRLHVLLKYEPEPSRVVLKKAHREWRRLRSEAA